MFRQKTVVTNNKPPNERQVQTLQITRFGVQGYFSHKGRSPKHIPSRKTGGTFNKNAL